MTFAARLAVGAVTIEKVWYSWRRLAPPSRQLRALSLSFRGVEQAAFLEGFVRSRYGDQEGKNQAGHTGSRHTGDSHSWANARVQVPQGQD